MAMLNNQRVYFGGRSQSIRGIPGSVFTSPRSIFSARVKRDPCGKKVWASQTRRRATIISWT